MVIKLVTGRLATHAEAATAMQLVATELVVLRESSTGFGSVLISKICPFFEGPNLIKNYF